MNRSAISHKVDTVFMQATALSLFLAIAIGALIPDNIKQPIQAKSTDIQEVKN